MHSPASLVAGFCALILRVRLDVEVATSAVEAAAGRGASVLIPGRTGGTCGVRGALHCHTDRSRAGKYVWVLHCSLSGLQVLGFFF